jgi:hypothetical protein
MELFLDYRTMPQTAEQRAAYNRAYREANKDKLAAKRITQKEARAEYARAYYQKHKEQIAENCRVWRDSHKDQTYNLANKKKVAEQARAYYRLPENKKANQIGAWKRAGLVSDDYDAMYSHYITSTNCQECGKEFVGKMGDGLCSFRCVNWDRTTGAYRGVTCCGCHRKT